MALNSEKGRFSHLIPIIDLNVPSGTFMAISILGDKGQETGPRNYKAN